MLLVILIAVLIAFYPFSQNHFFSPSHPDLLFMISHASFQHLAINILSILMVWLMAHKTGQKETRMLGVFLASSLVSLFIPLMFEQPVIGASAGIYGMIGYLLPDLTAVVPLPISYAVFFGVVLFENGLAANPWSKLFHAFGLTLGVVLRYMFDIHSINLKKTASSLGLGTDYYSLLGLGYPHGYVVYRLK